MIDGDILYKGSDGGDEAGNLFQSHFQTLIMNKIMMRKTQRAAVVDSNEYGVTPSVRICTLGVLFDSTGESRQLFCE